jgi:voltage-gated potassium channel
MVIPVIVIEQSVHDPTLRLMAYVWNWAIWVVFAAELVSILRVAPDRWRWLLQHPLEPLVVLLTPPFLPASLQAARVLRLLRLLRLLRIVQIARRLTTGQSLQFAAVLAAMTALGGGAAYAAVEGDQLTTWDGVWWAVVTMTTVGYGDLYPHTNAGRAIALGVMLVGIGFIAILTAAIAQRFVATQIAEVEQAEEALDMTEHQVLEEIRAITARLQTLEASMQRLTNQR